MSAFRYHLAVLIVLSVLTLPDIVRGAPSATALPSSATPAPTVPSRLNVYYLDFSVESMVPITPDALRRMRPDGPLPFYRTQLTSPDLIRALYDIVQPANGKPAARSTDVRFMDARLLIDSPDSHSSIVVGSGGVFDGAKNYDLTPDAFARLKILLNKQIFAAQIAQQRAAMEQDQKRRARDQDARASIQFLEEIMLRGH